VYTYRLCTFQKYLPNVNYIGRIAAEIVERCYNNMVTESNLTSRAIVLFYTKLKDKEEKRSFDEKKECMGER